MREGFHTYCLQTIASTTAQRYEREVLVVEGMMNLEYDTYNHFVSYYGTLKSSGYGDGTIHTIKSAIDKYLDFLIDQEVRDDNPSRLIE